MKNLRPSVFFCLVATFLMPACSSIQNPPAGKQAAASSLLEKKAPVSLGMSKSQVVSILGNPNTRTINSKGEIWTWSGTLWKRCLPLIGDHFNTERYSVEFGPGGKVTEFTVDHVFGHPFQEETTAGTILPFSSAAQ